ncbi:E3 ubiquitin-protein ligase rnf146-like [Sarcoptes scabiei]|nr:E3 ubiquitin-protein ligase rnf146-like [Sarcoptes scabiei]
MQKEIRERSQSKNEILVSIDDVYDLASEIGEHFRKLINLYGSESFEFLIPSVVRVLERLEDVISQRNDSINLIENLHKQIDELKQQLQKRSEEHFRYQNEMENIDEIWYNKIKALEQHIDYLRNENNCLNLKLNEFDEKFNSLPDSSDSLEPENYDCVSNDRTERKEVFNRFGSIAKIHNIPSRIASEEIDSLRETNLRLKSENANLIEENKFFRSIFQNSRRKSGSIAHQALIDISMEKDLRKQIEALESELNQYKSKIKAENFPIENAEEVRVESNKKYVEFSSPIEKIEDLPVHGPIPREPDEKQEWFRKQSKRNESILAFFPKLIQFLH